MGWTDKQWEAILHENKENILVSAGAGSGKTAILSERVIRKLKDGVNVNELLILTFTKAASEEMKDRIRTKIINNNLTEQLKLLDSSYITTFDSYALSIVKKYHYILGLDKDINLTDSSILKIELNKIIDNVLNEEYINKKDDFMYLVKTLLKKDDETLKLGIESILEKIELEIDTIEYLNSLKNIDQEKRYESILNLYLNEILDIKEQISSCLFNMESLIENEKEEEFVSKCNNYYSSLINAKNYNEIKYSLSNNEKLAINSKGINEDIATIKKEITVLVNKIKDLLEYPNEKFIKENYFNSLSLSNTILRLVEDIYIRYNEYKRKNNMFSFMDIAKLAIKIFKDNPDIANEIKESLNEIMIDEYQDTSNLQEIFVSYINKNNLYMVGDIKQSIYRFRYANPKLFKEKYFNYKDHKGGYLIDLNTNFRSRKEVLTNINEIFSEIMSKDLGGANYKKDHIIQYGNTDFLKDNIANQDNNLLIYDYDIKEYEGVDDSEIEAFIVANDIRNKIDTKYLVFDKKNGNREIKYSDFTILVDKRSDFKTYKSILEYKNIPVVLYQNENIIGQDDLYCFNSTLNLIQGYYNDNYDETFIHAYYSLAKSYLFSFNDNNILSDIINSNYKDTIIYKKLEPIVTNLDKMSINDIFKEIIKNLDWYNKLIYKSEVKSTEARLAYLINLSINLDKLSYSFDQTVDYFKTINEKELEIVLPMKASNENAVKIMTIHNSKGLEFPICYFVGFANSFNIDEIKDSYIVTKNGLVTSFINENKKYHNIEWYSYKKSFLEEEIGEKIRLLYVALTRAKEKMIMIMDSNSSKNKNLNESRNFLDFMCFIKEAMLKYTIKITSQEVNVDLDYKKYIPNVYLKNDFKPFEYKNINNNMMEITQKHFSKELNLEDKNNKILELGNHLHDLLFKLDFKNPDFSKMDSNDKFLINRFLKMDFLNIDNALKFYKEYEFQFNEEHGFIDLIIEYENEFKIIDYKLSNLDDDNYLNQLKGYKKYLSSISNKPIHTYLYSLLKGEYKCVD